MTIEATAAAMKMDTLISLSYERSHPYRSTTSAPHLLFIPELSLGDYAFIAIRPDTPLCLGVANTVQPHWVLAAADTGRLSGSFLPVLAQRCR